MAVHYGYDMKIGIVGTGFVGSTAAYTLVMRGLGTELVLIDKNTARASAEAADIRHAIPFAHSVNVHQGDYPDLAGCSAVIVALGKGRVAGQTRLDLAFENAAIFREVIPAIFEHSPCSVLIITTNPVDVMTHVATRIAVNLDVPPGLVIGTGTALDTARFRTLLGEFLDVESSHVHAYVLGEHGDSEVMAWSLARVGGLTIDEMCSYLGKEFDAGVKRRINDDVRHAGHDIIVGKGATYYGIGSVLAHIVDVVVHDHRSILTVSTFVHDCEGVRDVTLSLPHILGGRGAIASLPLSLDAGERSELKKSAEILRRSADALGIS